MAGGTPLISVRAVVFRVFMIGHNHRQPPLWLLFAVCTANSTPTLPSPVARPPKPFWQHTEAGTLVTWFTMCGLKGCWCSEASEWAAYPWKNAMQEIRQTGGQGPFLTPSHINVWYTLPLASLENEWAIQPTRFL